MKDEETESGKRLISLLANKKVWCISHRVTLSNIEMEMTNDGDDDGDDNDDDDDDDDDKED